MGALMQHRGPDGEGFVIFRGTDAPLMRGGPDTPIHLYTAATPYSPERPVSRDDYSNARLALGHRRLAIVDLSEFGHQPMSSPEGDHWIVFNGEIYNHVELRAELETLGHRFPSHSDTAVILAAYRQWGVDCLVRFNGMFAFALYDCSRDMLFLARDRFGVKPLNLWCDGRTFAFTSEIKALLAIPGFRPAADTAAMKDYLCVGPREDEPGTMFEGVTKLPAASFIYATPQALLDGTVQPTTWWKLKANPSKEPYRADLAAKLAEEYRSRLGEAVRLRLRADVKIGSALSGGLDSSSIVWLIASQLREQGADELQETFSTVYRTPGVEKYDESVFIEKVGRGLDVSVNMIEPDPTDVPHEHERMIWNLDTPPESTLMSSWHTFRLVHHCGIKVTLDGQGADEQLGGYLYYLPHSIVGRSPLRMVQAAAALIGAHPNRLAWGSIGFAMLGSRLPETLLGNDRQRMTARMLPKGLNAHLAQDTRGSLANLLHYADRTSMAFSVESRAPFLDVNLAEFLATVPEAYKIHDGWTKHLARRAMDGRLPADVTWRRDKMGWPIPEVVWENGPLAEWFGSASASSEVFCDLGIGEAFQAARDAADVTTRIRAINLAAWHRMFIRDGWKALNDRRPSLLKAG
jgi:asparagine synthase (glutamine-hydrolysing)